jgi:hypothetical protein
MRIPPFRNTNFPSAKTIIFQESRTSFIDCSGTRNAGKRPGQRLDGRPDAHHDSRELWGYLLDEAKPSLTPDFVSGAAWLVRCWPVVMSVANRIDTFPITCALDGHAHDVTDDSLTAGQHTGQYQALCGYLVSAAALAPPIGRLCARCTTIIASRREQPATVRSSRRRHRHRKGGGDRWGWIARIW